MSKRAIIFGGIGLAAVAAMVAFLLEPDPQTVLRKAQRKLVAEDAMRLDIEGKLVLPPKDLTGIAVVSATSVDIVMRTDLDLSVPLKPSSSTTFAFTQGAGATSAKLSGDARRKDGRHYLKLEETGKLSDDFAGRVKGKWVASDRSFLEFILPSDERSLDERPLDADGLKEMAGAVAGVDLFRVTRKLPNADIGGMKARHYVVALNMEAVSALMLKLRGLRTGAPVDAEDVLAVTADIIRWGQPIGEVWVGKRDGKFLKVELVSALDGDAVSGAVGGAVTLSRYGVHVDIQAPEAEDIEKALGPLFTKRLSLAGGRGAETTPETAPVAPTPPSPGAAIQESDTDDDGFSDGQENFYGSDAWNPDTDADGWSDGLEVGKGMNPIGPGALFGFGL